MAEQKERKPKAKPLTAAGIRKALPNASDEQVQAILNEQLAPAVKRKAFILAQPDGKAALLTEDEAKQVEQVLTKAGMRVRLKPRFKGSKKKSDAAKQSTGKGAGGR